MNVMILPQQQERNPAGIKVERFDCIAFRQKGSPPERIHRPGTGDETCIRPEPKRQAFQFFRRNRSKRICRQRLFVCGMKAFMHGPFQPGQVRQIR